ncbi:MAG: AMP-binding protein [Candidatus Binatia bacterium]
MPIAVRSTAAEAARAAHPLARRGVALRCRARRRRPRRRRRRRRAGVRRRARPAAAPAGGAPRRRRRSGAARPRPQDLAVLAYTSGTTGAPKGVMVHHRHLLWAALACGAARGDTQDGVGASISPLTHTPVFVSHLLCRILVGATTVLLEKFDLPTLLEHVERHGVTDLPLIGGMTFEMVAMGEIPASVRRTVRKVSVGGAPTPMSTKRALAELFDDAEIIEAYGQSESTDGVTMARGQSVFERPGTVGRPNPHIVVAIRRPDGQASSPAPARRARSSSAAPR